MSTSDVNASQRISLRYENQNYPYSSSIASSASSSRSSVFSSDEQSSQSSAPSSPKSALSSDWEIESSGTRESDIASTDLPTKHHDATLSTSKPCTAGRPSVETAVAPELRQNPRRTRPSSIPDCQFGSTQVRPPCSLVRQCDRKDNFVESLVGKLTVLDRLTIPVRLLTSYVFQDATTQMIEVIWPLSVVPCGRDTVLGGKNLIGLRTFIQEVLKRSKTSYSTLQVALYYLILIKSLIPKVNFTMEQTEESHASRAMQCGRRMFLAALILASKYLQDRNYSARAWSKISGLKVSEINDNEMAFVTAVNWRLHVPEPLFQRWTDIVIKYSPPTQSPSSPSFCSLGSWSWKSIVTRLTPELDDFENDGLPSYIPSVSEAAPVFGSGYSNARNLSMPPPSLLFRSSPPISSSSEATPTIPFVKPQVLEPTMRDSPERLPRFPPISPRMSLLPTPQMTPQVNNFGTPAVSASGICPIKSISYAMKQVQSMCMARTTLDLWPTASCPDNSAYGGKPSLPFDKRPSITSCVSAISSPESMVSDTSSRSSRSSSISSMASSTCALPQPEHRLAVQATRRCANMQLASIKENSRLAIRSSPNDGLSWEGFTSSPDTYAIGPRESYVRGTRPELLQKPGQLSVFSCSEFADREAAEGLRDLALNRHRRTLPPLQPLSPCRSTKNRKRGRPSSIGDDILQQGIRDIMTPSCSGDIKKIVNEEDGTVLTDAKVADSFLFNMNVESFRLPHISATVSHVRGSSCGGGARKRCKEDCETDRNSSLTATIGSGPGMWAGVL